MYKLTIFLAVIISVLAVFAKNKWKETNWAGKTIMLLLIASAIVGGFISYKKEKKDALIERVSAKFGDIEDLKGATIPLLSIGDGVNSISLNSMAIFTQNGSNEPLFKVYVKENKLFADIVIRGQDTKPIAVINENVWTIFNDDYEYNNDDTGFEIVTKGDRKVYFQIYLKNGVTHILGIVTNNEGDGMKFMPQSKNNPPDTWGVMMMIRSDDSKEQSKLNYQPLEGAIFKYPRGKFLGVRK